MSDSLERARARTRLRLNGRAWKIALAYAVVAGLWIYFSDAALGLLVRDPDLLVRLSVYKGIFFVLVTATILLLTIRRSFRAIEDGYLFLKAEEEERRRHQAEAERMGRLYSALSQVNQAIVRAPDREALFERACHALVGFGGFRAAWIGWRDPKTERVFPAARAGDLEGYLETIEVFADDRPGGRGPTGLALRSGIPYVANDLASDPAKLRWREEALARGFAASGAFPILVGGEVQGVLNVYAGEDDFFHDQERALLEEVANDLSFALDSFEREAARARAEAAAASERAFSDTMIDSMPGILYLYTTEGRFLRWNRNFEAVSGYAPEEIAGMSPLDFFAPEDRPLLETRIGEVFERGESSVEAPFLSKDGTRTPYFFTGRAVQFEGHDCLVGMGVDVSARREAEAALRELNRTLERKVAERTEELRAALVRAEAADRLKSAFLATMSHELRTPLNSIIGFTGILLQELAGPLTPEQSKQLGMVLRSARHLLELISDVLDLSKIEAGQLEVRREAFELAEVIRGVGETVRPLAEGKGLTIDVSVAPDVGAIVSDARRVQQVLLNLVNNGIKFTEDGGVRLVATRVDGRVDIRVRDTGIGIRSDDLGALFQPFRQIDTGLARQHEGTGLGLAICRRLVDLLGGEIGVTSEWGKGTEVHLTLPTEAPHPESREG